MGAPSENDFHFVLDHVANDDGWQRDPSDCNVVGLLVFATFSLSLK
jgi:hypothetical protein